MKILVVNNMAPFVWGGAEELAVNLCQRLIDSGHESEVLRIPFQWHPATCIPSQMMMARTMQLWGVDRVIALKFPAYLIPHAEKTLWLLHQYRQAYDLYDAGQSNIGKDPLGQELRTIIRNADNECFQKARKIFTNSHVTQDRLQRYNGFTSEVLLPPLNDAELFTGAPQEHFILAGGRVNGMKRQHLLLEALALMPNGIRLIIAGPPDSPADATRLHQMAESLSIKDRVTFRLEFLPRRELADLMNRASAVAYLPFDEDSLGYVAMEAATAGKPIITTTDSGGILKLAIHGTTGLVAAPKPSALADAMNRISTHPAQAASMGMAARSHWHGMGINWETTLERLLA